MMTLIFIRWSVWSDDDQVMIISRHTTVTSSFARPICQPDATGSCLLSKNSQSSYITTCKNHQTEKKWIILWLQNCKIHNETLEGVVYNINFILHAIIMIEEFPNGKSCDLIRILLISSTFVQSSPDFRQKYKLNDKLNNSGEYKVRQIEPSTINITSWVWKSTTLTISNSLPNIEIYTSLKMRRIDINWSLFQSQGINGDYKQTNNRPDLLDTGGARWRCI